MSRVRFFFLCLLVASAFRAPVSATLIQDHRDASIQGDVWDAQPAAYVVDIVVSLRKNVPVVFSTEKLSKGADPILHLLAPNASVNGAVAELAQDDDSGGSLNARLTYTPPADGNYHLLLRATSRQGEGTCTLLQDGRPLLTTIQFGAALREYKTLRRGETLTMVPLPNGLTAFPALYFFDSNGKLVRRHLPVNGVVSATMDTSYTSVYVLAAKSIPVSPTGPIRVVRNDALLSNHDLDRDGLGNELEATIGTCSSSSDVVGNWECNRAADDRDTDGDGLSDALELLGKTNVNPPLLLPLWGADPRHKDIFIEVDFSQAFAGETDSRMPAATARAMAASYADSTVPPTSFDAVLHAQYLGNPDLQPGVRLHLDTGRAPELAGDATIYGNWGGYSVVPPLCDANGCRRQAANIAYQTSMASQRRGIFHYNNSYVGGGGQCPLGVIACSWNQADDYIAPHEFGHTLTLHHYGPSVYPADGNCKVNYPSLMNYAPPPVYVFSDGYGRPSFNNASLKEIGAVPNPTFPRSQEFLMRLRDSFKYLVDLGTGDVDWNRDGIFQSGTVSAYSNSYPNSNCEFTSVNRIPLGRTTLRTPAIARLVSQVYVFYLNSANRLEVLASDYNPFQCNPTLPECSGTQFTNYPIDQPWNQGIVSVAAQSLIEGELPKLLVTYTDTAGRLWQTSLWPVNGQPTFTQPVAIPTARPVAEEISLTTRGLHGWLAYKDSTGALWLRRRLNSQWGPETQIKQSLATPVPSVPAGTSPAILEAPDGTLYGAFPAPSGSLLLWKRDPASELWSNTGYLYSGQIVSTRGKPAMAWRELPAGAALPGRLYLYWSPNNGGIPGALKESWLTRNSAGTVSMGLTMNHSNSWFAGYGVAALYDPGFDDEIRLVVPFVGSNPDGALELRPRADGLAPINQVDRNDWEEMGLGLCRVLVGQQTVDPIVCPN